MPQDREMHVNVLVEVYWGPNPPRQGSPNGWCARATYSLLSGTGPGVSISSDGTIDLPGVELGGPYNDNCHITFTLDSNSHANTTGAPADPRYQGSSSLAVRWATEISADDHKSAMMCGTKVDVPAAPGGYLYTIQNNPLMVSSWVNGPQSDILLTDNDDSGNSYNYRPAVVITALDNDYVPLDPRIAIRPPH